MRVGAIVLHYRYWPQVNATLDSLARQHRPLEHVLVVDNRSDDGSAEQLRDRGDIQLVEAGHNGGYAAGMNLGLRTLDRLQLDAVLLLTHEAVLNPDGVRALVDQLDADPELGAVGPLLAWREDPATVYSAGVSFNPRTWTTHHIGAGDRVQDWSTSDPQRVDSLDGAAVLIRRSALASAGPFDESYFLYFEEADYFMRMRRLGWAVACVPAALALQQPGQPPAALWVRNSLRFMANYAPRRILARELLRTVFHGFGDIAHGRTAEARDRVTGIAAFISGKPASALVARR